MNRINDYNNEIYELKKKLLNYNIIYVNIILLKEDRLTIQAHKDTSGTASDRRGGEYTSEVKPTVRQDDRI